MPVLNLSFHSNIVMVSAHPDETLGAPPVSGGAALARRVRRWPDFGEPRARFAGVPRLALLSSSNGQGCPVFDCAKSAHACGRRSTPRAFTPRANACYNRGLPVPARRVPDIAHEVYSSDSSLLGGLIAADFANGPSGSRRDWPADLHHRRPEFQQHRLGAVSGIAYAANTLFVADSNGMGAAPVNNRVLMFQNLSSICPSPRRNCPT